MYHSTVELYSPIVGRWSRPDFSLRFARAGASVVTVPASWIPECADEHFQTREEKLMNQ